MDFWFLGYAFCRFVMWVFAGGLGISRLLDFMLYSIRLYWIDGIDFECRIC